VTAWRTEPCACGGPDIRAPSLKHAAIHIDLHNAGPVHQAWRRMREADIDEARAAYLQALDDYRVSRRPTAGVSPVDSVQGEPGASASGNAA
jgi:hypothetical protein